MQNWLANYILREQSGHAGASIWLTLVPIQFEPDIVVDRFTEVSLALTPYLVILLYVMPLYRGISRISLDSKTGLT
jgi:hypothetical protein